MNPDRLRIAPYSPALAERWNTFVRNSKNGTFLFDRSYMDYHADRFVDASLLAFEGDDDANLVALLPANSAGADLVSHGGLTYGGWVTDRRMTTAGMLTLFDRLRSWSSDRGLKRLRYKAVPRCYHRLPAEEDLYALAACGAQLTRQDVASIIDLPADLAWSRRRRHALSKARAAGVTVELSADFMDFRSCLVEALARHAVEPVHSVAELELLAGRFPDQIRLYVARLHTEAIAYALVFDTGQTVHTQYLAAREAGRAQGGLDAIIHRLQREDYSDRRYLSFGVSSENGGQALNPGLIAQKEMFGARAMICSTFELPLR